MDIAWDERPAVRPGHVRPACDDRAHNEVRLFGVEVGQRDSSQRRSRIGVDNRNPACGRLVHVHGVELAAIHQDQERNEK